MERSKFGWLERIILPEGLSEIGEEAFAGTHFLSELTVPGSVEVLGELGAAPLQGAEKLEARFGTTLRVTDRNGQVYYLGYGGLGYLEIVRRDAPDGEILYAPED